jgi:hypothetical protein
MLNIFRGQRPDVTPAQVAAVLVAGIPALATLLSAFGLAELTQDQQDALANALTWCAILAALLIGGDTTLRTARNVADSRRDSAAWLNVSPGGPPPSGAAAGAGAGAHDPDADAAELALTVTDEEELDGGSINGGGGLADPDPVEVDE